MPMPFETTGSDEDDEGEEDAEEPDDEEDDEPVVKATITQATFTEIPEDEPAGKASPDEAASEPESES